MTMAQACDDSLQSTEEKKAEIVFAQLFGVSGHVIRVGMV